jgi:hypothetical protein
MDPEQDIARLEARISANLAKIAKLEGMKDLHGRTPTNALEKIAELLQTNEECGATINWLRGIR